MKKKKNKLKLRIVPVMIMLLVVFIVGFYLGHITNIDKKETIEQKLVSKTTEKKQKVDNATLVVFNQTINGTLFFDDGDTHNVTFFSTDKEFALFVLSNEFIVENNDSIVFVEE